MIETSAPGQGGQRGEVTTGSSRGCLIVAVTSVGVFLSHTSGQKTNAGLLVVAAIVLG